MLAANSWGLPQSNQVSRGSAGELQARRGQQALTAPARAGPLFLAHAEHHLPNGVQSGGAGEGVPEPQVHLPQLHGETLGVPDHPATAGANVGGPHPRWPAGAATHSPSTFPSVPLWGGGATGSAGTGHLPGIERGGGGILGKLQTLPVGTSQKGLEGRESPSIRGGPAEPLTSPTCRVSASATEKQALETRALNLSLHYCFVTPLTSMVVTKPDGGERSEVAEKPMETNRGESRTPASLAAHF